MSHVNILLNVKWFFSFLFIVKSNSLNYICIKQSSICHVSQSCYLQHALCTLCWTQSLIMHSTKIDVYSSSIECFHQTWTLLIVPPTLPCKSLGHSLHHQTYFYLLIFVLLYQNELFEAQNRSYQFSFKLRFFVNKIWFDKLKKPFVRRILIPLGHSNSYTFFFSVKAQMDPIM